MGVSQSSISILCVDDEPGLADLTATFLERFDDDFSTRTAHSAHDGLAYLAEHDVDCIVSDHDMPGMDGLAFLEAVRATNPDLPFILFTGRGSEDIASDAISAGVSEYMQKASANDQFSVLGQRVRNHVARTRTHRAKQEAETRAETILRASPDAIVVSVDREFVYANPAAADLYGVDDPAELLGRPVGEFIHPDYRDDVDDTLQAVEAGTRPSDRIPRTLLSCGGAERPVEVTARHVRWDGEDGVVAIVRDVSTEPDPVEHNAPFEASFRQAFDAMVITDADGQCLHVNQSACDLFGVEEAALLGRSVADFLPEAADLEAALRTGQDGAIDQGTLRVVRDDGDERIAEYTATTDVSTGEQLSVLRDVTEREDRESVIREMHTIISDRDLPFEAQVRSLLELGRTELDVDYGSLSQIRGDDYIFEVVDAADDTISAGDVVPVSATNCEIAASRRETLVLGDVARDAPSETDRAGYSEWGIACYLGAPVFVESEVYGTFCFYDTEPRDGQFSEWDVTLVDLMSRWVSYELNRQQTTDRLKAQNEKLDEFASIVSHDLRNPLTVLQGSLELAERTGDADHFETCYRAIDRMNTLIDDLLSLARAGSIIDETKPVDLVALVKECWQGVDVAAGRLQLDLDTSTAIHADRSRLRQLLENLIRNAFDHGSDDTTVTVGRLPDGFYLEDDGPGIPAEDRETVFESGYSTRTDGTGFGLAIVKEIVDAHGWRLRVTDGTEGGARFEIAGVEFSDA